MTDYTATAISRGDHRVIDVPGVGTAEASSVDDLETIRRHGACGGRELRPAPPRHLHHVGGATRRTALQRSQPARPAPPRSTTRPPAALTRAASSTSRLVTASQGSTGGGPFPRTARAKPV